ncbi:MFS permease [Bradyrhizobium diazoefficiens USDA 110]|uniref:MFS permease n=2 Tax=Bradyrhizobium diazoefficiens TaxID=1355477 RepID=Q89ME2_BRADU|nr:MFS transporter [Bradyrhizobium diazoefficiens]BAC49516.1 MFS permease [Bradyrhizobium diazoefficiens USDA 110]QBP23018.1 MFS transporter [Bradyrhizobium diazoefficiens]BCE21876.1 MFS transporter [Bradyrhizobium diazoefficiens]BCE48123.1 MFS transporter [Bradyrhizobium diazoefficiens]
MRFATAKHMTKIDENQTQSASPWIAFRHKAFTVVWIATVVANVGTWMYNAASGWLMTSLNPDPLTVSLVQVASSLPMFLFALPAGALADTVDRRRFLIGSEILLTVVATVSAVLVWLDLINPSILLLFTFLLGAGSAFTAPAWQSIVPQLVPKQDLAAAVATNGVGVNISRAIGPALGGIVIGVLGIAAPFWINALSNFAVIGALLWWRPPTSQGSSLPPERLTGALVIGFRHARYNLDLRATLIRAVAFFFFASAYWALLPLVARNQIAGGPELYGILLGAIGIGAVGGAFALPWLKAVLGPDRLVSAGTLGTAACLVLLGVARYSAIGFAACLLAGMSWIAVLASLNVSVQMSLPDWVRGRGLAMFVTVFFGAMTAGSALWGQLASAFGLPAAHFIAAAGAVAGIALTWRWKLQGGQGVDLAPSMHWPAPVLAVDADADRGPVLITVEYQINPEKRDGFLAAIRDLGQQRQRDGAYSWDVFEDAAASGRFLETFMVASWLEHLRQHQRVTNADKVVQDAIREFGAAGEPKVTHFIAARLASD